MTTSIGRGFLAVNKYRDQLCTFNDDIQGTAAVAAGTLMAALKVTGLPWSEQRIALVGAGAAGCGIASLLLQAMIQAGLSEEEARTRFYAVDMHGLLVEGMADLRPAQLPFVQNRAAVANWTRHGSDDHIDLLDVMNNAKPTVLIGVSGQAGAFSEAAIRAMAASVARPVIFPLSNPTSRCEAVPEDLINWSDGCAIIGTGSPFSAVNWQGMRIPIAQTNNSYVFPGIGLGALVVKAQRVTDAMFMVAAQTLAELSPARLDPTAPLLPPIAQMRDVARTIAYAVARQAMADGVAPTIDDAQLKTDIEAAMWMPIYRPYRKV